MMKSLLPVIVTALVAGCSPKMDTSRATPPTVTAPAQALALPSTPIDNATKASCTAPPDPAFANRIPANGIDQLLLDRAVLHRTNIERCNAGLSPLQPDGGLLHAAYGHSVDMVRHRFFGHTSPVPGKAEMTDRLALSNVRFRTAAENLATAKRLDIASGQPVYRLGREPCAYGLTPTGRRVPVRTYESLAQNLVTRWMRSPGHRRNILNPRYSRHGSAGVINPDNRICQGVNATQLFAG